MNVVVTSHPAQVSVRPKSAGISVGGQVVKEYVERPAYDGPYEVIPSEEEQVLLADGKRMTENVTIGAIPQNYGRVSQHGNIITVW